MYLQAGDYGPKHEKRGATMFANFALRVSALGCLAYVGRYGLRHKEQKNTLHHLNQNGGYMFGHISYMTNSITKIWLCTWSYKVVGERHLTTP